MRPALAARSAQALYPGPILQCDLVRERSLEQRSGVIARRGGNLGREGGKGGGLEDLELVEDRNLAPREKAIASRLAVG
jgi:hypothetical protein